MGRSIASGHRLGVQRGQSRNYWRDTVVRGAGGQQQPVGSLLFQRNWQAGHQVTDALLVRKHTVHSDHAV
ncbi:hypothetical protein DFA_00208 [Cavenderia fasciculata]|uniref:Uncharacterized protein n=1 Tax=Cavenderia fasciculata TaxID=261658 RepID=F4PXX0_CACFS|nr:uncharacterized protein DFA_00208 [Cavenderia fasciculata]EGG19630.1 hypothetical protein DFA_00208 [Cavenderia fasciculata]|eukprot:XP_004357924.1 hypothetical protein DFA_00208 [Cavenderia fasciculata]